jgi:hypothetical protein
LRHREPRPGFDQRRNSQWQRRHADAARTSSVTLNHAAFNGGGIANLGNVNCSAAGMVFNDTSGFLGGENCLDHSCN